MTFLVKCTRCNFLRGTKLFEIKLLAGAGAIRSFTTESQTVPPIVVTKPAMSITESNATIAYELVSYDGTHEIILYWGSFDHGENAGLWENQQSLGIQSAGVGTSGY